jgi:hypothetical protein
MKLFMFNVGHNGDVHLTREFVKDIMNKTKFDEYYYLHSNSPKVLCDIPNLKHSKLDDNCHGSVGNTFFQVNNDIYINMTCFFDIEYYYKLYEIIYGKLQIRIENIDFYLPSINYKVLNLDNIKDFLKNNFKTKVLISNGVTKSFQSGDVDFYNLIDEITKEFPDVQFLLTSKEKLIKDNIFYTDDVINKQDFDLNEISYLSTFCDIIIGRASGPDVFCMVKENYNNPYKTIISMSNNVKQAFFDMNNMSGKIWINNYDYNNIHSVLINEIKRVTEIDKIFTLSKKEDRIFIYANQDINDVEIKFYIPEQKKSNNYNDFKIGDLIYTLKDNFFNGTSSWVRPFMEYNNSYRLTLKFIIGNNMYIKQI